MMNYQKEMDGLLEQIRSEGITPRLLLHSCCAPCSSYCLEYLSDYFSITDFYYNPNISPESEYRYRVSELKRLIEAMHFKNDVTFIEGDYDPQRFYDAASGLENEPERGKRCTECFRLRLEEAAKLAAELQADYFTTTLTISPMKDADLLNAIGQEMGERYHVRYLPSDFKKRNGYKRSIELSREYDLYRQNYCGCIFSKREAEARESAKKHITQET